MDSLKNVSGSPKKEKRKVSGMNRKEMLDLELAFVDKLNDDGVDMCLIPRRFMALEFRFGGYCLSDMRKTCIWSGGTYPWAEKCYGLKWVAVHGLKSICVVIRRNDLDMACVGPFFKSYSEESVMFSLTAALISEIGDLADELRKRSGPFIEKPFGVVSVNHFEEESGHDEASSAEYDEKKAIEFLKEKMKRSCSEYTWEKTIQTTISAFQHLCLEELTADDIFEKNSLINKTEAFLRIRGVDRVVCVCQDIETAAYNLWPNVIKDLMNTSRCSS